MDLTGALWRKSSRSGDDGGECVEVAVNLPMAVAVRDSKNPGGAVLHCGHGEWRAFLCELRDGCFGR
ncbi:DUF397 domain-containing protein [Sphaerisporangium aureirubrum]|uniref:DUF397 domain-containing protein n=1 Tax=Sphaerisporangium aureirubrum TaxID=1544736 RepID=A0ABW1NAH5_9ACTN